MSSELLVSVLRPGVDTTPHMPSSGSESLDLAHTEPMLALSRVLVLSADDGTRPSLH